jgi:hypothetical protein
MATFIIVGSPDPRLKQLIENPLFTSHYLHIHGLPRLSLRIFVLRVLESRRRGLVFSLRSQIRLSTATQPISDICRRCVRCTGSRANEPVAKHHGQVL